MKHDMRSHACFAGLTTFNTAGSAAVQNACVVTCLVLSPRTPRAFCTPFTHGVYAFCDVKYVGVWADKSGRHAQEQTLKVDSKVQSFMHVPGFLFQVTQVVIAFLQLMIITIKQ